MAQRADRPSVLYKPYGMYSGILSPEHLLWENRNLSYKIPLVKWEVLEQLNQCKSLFKTMDNLLYMCCTLTCPVPLAALYLNQPCPGPPLCGWPPVCTWWTWPCQTSSCVCLHSLSPLSLPLRWATKGHREELVRHRKELVRHMTQLVRHRTQLVRHMTKIIKHTS